MNRLRRCTFLPAFQGFRCKAVIKFNSQNWELDAISIQSLHIPMKFPRILIPILAFALLPLVTNPVFAAKKPKPKSTPKPQKVNASGSKIESVSNDSISVTTSKTKKTYKIDSHTAITVNERKGTAADLKSGMHVEVDASNINPDLALSIKARTD